MKALLLMSLLLAGASVPAAQVPTVINVEIDYMVASDHSHEPSPAVLAALVQMFACQGITLNLQVDDALPHVNLMGCNLPGVNDFWTCTNSPNSYANQRSRQQGSGWHYAIMGHQYNNGGTLTSSGLARPNGIDFIVTLGAFNSGAGGTDFQIAATFAHELGHNLGLNHSAPGTTNASGPYAPNYASVMSYQFQLNGVRQRMECLGLAPRDNRLKQIDYSHGRMPALVESELSEAIGVGMHKVDWNCNGSLNSGTVSVNLDFDDEWCAPLLPGNSILRDSNDWSLIRDITDTSRAPSEDNRRKQEACISWEEHQQMVEPSEGLNDPSVCDGQASPTLTIEACLPSNQMVWVDPNAGFFQFGSGSFPYKTILQATNSAPIGAVIYLQPGTYSNATNALVLTKKVVITGPANAKIDS